MATVANLVVKVSASATDFEREMLGLQKTLARTGGKLQSLGSDLTKGITLPLAAIGLTAAKAAIDFESSFTGVAKTVDGVADKTGKLTQFGEELAQGMRDLAKTMPVNVNELNRIGEAAGQLGIKKEDILGFTSTMAKLGATTNLTAEDAATSIAQIQNIFNASGKNTENFASALVALGNDGASTERDIVEMATRIAGAANQIGISQADVLGFSSALANLGINAEAGGTALSRVMSSISVAADMGGEKIAGFAEVAGMSSAAFQALFKADASEAVARFVEGLGRAKESGANLTMILKDLGQGDIRVMDALKRMAGAGDQLRTSLDLARTSWQQNTALTEEYQKRANDTASQLKVLWNRVQDVAITLGTAMLPTIRALVEASAPFIRTLEGMVTAFSELPVPVQATVFGLGALAAAAGPAIYVAGTLIKSWGAVAGSLRLVAGPMEAIGPAATTSAVGVRILWAAFAPFAGAAAVVGGIAAITMAVRGLTQANQQAAQSGVIVGGEGLPMVLPENLNGQVSEDAQSQLPALYGYLSNIEIAKQKAAELAKAANGGASGGGGAWGGMPQATAEVSEFERAVQSLTGKLSGTEMVAGVNQWMEAIERIGGIGALTHDELTQFQDDVVKAVEKMRLMGDAVPRTWALIADSIRNNSILQASRESLGDSLSSVGLNKQQLLLPSSQGQLEGLMNALPPVVTNQNASAGMSKQVSTFRNDIAMLSDAFGNLGQIGNGAINSITRGIGTAISSINVGTNAITSLKNGFAQLGSGGMLQGLAGLASGIGSIVGIASLAVRGIGALINKLKGGEEGQLVNPARDAFLTGFGGSGTGAGSGFGNLAAQLTSLTGEDSGGALFQALTQADTMAEFDAAVSAIEAKLATAKAGMADVSGATDTFNMSLTGSDEAIKQLGDTQLTVTEMMLDGFSQLIEKLDEMIARLGIAGSMAAGLVGAEAMAETGGVVGGERAYGGETAQLYSTMPDPGFNEVVADGVGQAMAEDSGGISIAVENVNTSDAEAFIRDLPTAVRQNRRGLRSGLRVALGVA